ncbi:SMP-30/gluconolactonase/LRE family protein [Flammeovirga kamogawensis]|uniref:SMP-30/gluconolactonase/LRE family protein n=1 Tax=Flammeovirga kamogawensis TaxID=373891 RepID=A0ABX8GZ24_9BACT|nr:SMP-30/gluconolactonase/LRE family protein [Flammeovirga kamogawensis]MBB6459299.1 sugar lactone lactonase YvrE [Flammeovirga kamogawensis]QWG08859.1 SMP-30/gluconolactonase/LRE family protein [Flammeovirga kamogawensis]TRX67149.1 SMP-30/gluconolactonase/LRE family protein [Flammeovirga kamogawensis]
MRHQIYKITFALFINFLFQACALHPAAWQPPTKPILEHQYSLNNKLQSATKIKLNGWYGPEDIIFDAAGNLYCGVHKATDDFSDGKILKITPQNNVEVYYNAGSWVAGLHFDADSNLIALSHKEGLIRITADKKVTILATKDEKERPFLIPNGLDIAKDSTIYFSNTSHSSTYTIPYGRQLILEIKPNGGLYKYNPKTAQITTLIDGTYFGNGVVLSKNEDFILMTETTKYRILKYWLKGSKAGETEILIDNLPGFPNGISIREDGSFWVGFTTKRNDALDGIQAHKGMKKLVYSLPEFLQPKQELFGIILNISEEGKVLSALYDTTGKIIPEAGAVKEYNNALYIGGDIIEYIGKYQLDKNKFF